MSEILEHLHRVERGVAAVLASASRRFVRELDLYQWNLFVAEHGKRHTSPVRDVARKFAAAS